MLFENEGNEQTTVAIYTRKSYREDVDGKVLTPYKQPQACLAYIEERPELKWRVLPTKYMDKDAKGDTPARAAYRELLLDGIAAKYRVLVVYSIDRFSTNAKHLPQQLGLVNACGVRVFCVNEARFIDPADVANEEDARHMIGKNMPWLHFRQEPSENNAHCAGYTFSEWDQAIEIANRIRRTFETANR